MAILSLLTAALAVGSVNAHLFISSPPPIAGSAPKDPLDPSGSNFPCHGVSFPGSGGMAMPAGSNQLLAFDTGNGANTAVHGGGSCQISVTYETDPVKIKDPKNWYVIHSIEEGCPTNSPLNLDGTYTGADGQTYTGAYQCNDTDANTNGFDCVNQFHFEIPKSLKNGQATLSWTWFNNVGNREMYQNCVAVDITGGASDDSQMQELPGMFVANLASVSPGCSTTEGTNVAFPQPGPVLEIKKPSPVVAVASASSSYPIATPKSCPNMARNGNAAQPSLVSDDPSAPTAAPAPTSGAVVPADVPSSTFVTSIQSAPFENSTAVAPTATGTGPASEPTGSCPAGSVPCTTLGALVCPDSTHYGLCDLNYCAVSQPVAAGTQCKDGAIGFADGYVKRNALQGHLHRHIKHLNRRH